MVFFMVIKTCITSFIDAFRKFRTSSAITLPPQKGFYFLLLLEISFVTFSEAPATFTQLPLRNELLWNTIWPTGQMLNEK